MERGVGSDGAVSCPHGERCGGCALLGRSADAQAAFKQQRVSDALERYPALRALPASAIARGEPGVGYRTRAKLVVDGARVGLFARGSHDVVDIPECRVLSPALATVADGVRGLLSKRDPRELELAGVDLREAQSDEGTRVLVTLLGPERAQDALRVLAQEVMALPGVASVALASRDADSAAFFGAAPVVVSGPTTLRDRLDHELPWALASHGSFTQAHRAQAARLTRRVLERLDGALTGLRGKHVLELYAGQGSLGLALARAGAGVLLVERFAPALAMTREAAAQQGIPPPEVRADDVGQAVADLCDAGERFDAVIADPPRHGLPPAVREGLARLAPRCLAYVSCEPATFARDLAHLARLGYATERVEPFDMMPLSGAVECFALLVRSAPPALEVLHEDDALLVVDKPPYLPTTPQSGHADSVLARMAAARGGAALHAVHRLDRDTSGVCLLAKHRDAVAPLAAALAAGHKRYLALVRGICRPKGIVRRPLVHEGRAREAVTRYTRLQVVAGHSLIRARPEQGRTHQVRRHLAALGHPVLGDARHGDAASNRHFALAHGLDRSFLHLAQLELVHPRTQATLVLEAKLAPDLAAVLDALRDADSRAILSA